MESLRLHSVIGIYHFIVLIVLSIHLYIQLSRDERLWEIMYLSTAFLTNWNFFCLVSAFYGYLIYDIVDVFGWYSKLNRLFKIFVDYCFYSFVAPVSIIVTLLFWSLWNYDKNLVFGFNGLLEVLLPLWLSHIFHTVISLLALIQTYHNKVCFKTRYLLGGFLLYVYLYYAWIEINYRIFNAWPYPLLGKFTTFQRHLFINSLIAISVCIVILFHYLNRKYCLRHTKTEVLSTRLPDPENPEKRSY